MDGNDIMDSTSFVLCFTCLLKIAIDRDKNELRGTFIFFFFLLRQGLALFISTMKRK